MRFIAKIEQLLSHDDTINALVILETITNEYVDACNNFEDMYDEEGGIAAVIEDLFYELILTWCKTIAIANLSDEDEKRITYQIKKWQKKLELARVILYVKSPLILLRCCWN